MLHAYILQFILNPEHFSKLLCHLESAVEGAALFVAGSSDLS